MGDTAAWLGRARKERKKVNAGLGTRNTRDCQCELPKSLEYETATSDVLSVFLAIPTSYSRCSSHCRNRPSTWFGCPARGKPERRHRALSGPGSSRQSIVALCLGGAPWLAKGLHPVVGRMHFAFAPPQFRQHAAVQLHPRRPTYSCRKRSLPPGSRTPSASSAKAHG